MAKKTFNTLPTELRHMVYDLLIDPEARQLRLHYNTSRFHPLLYTSEFFRHDLISYLSRDTSKGLTVLMDDCGGHGIKDDILEHWISLDIHQHITTAQPLRLIWQLRLPDFDRVEVMVEFKGEGSPVIEWESKPIYTEHREKLEQVLGHVDGTPSKGEWRAILRPYQTSWFWVEPEEEERCCRSDELCRGFLMPEHDEEFCSSDEESSADEESSSDEDSSADE